ncbi:calcium/sodium antiporter [Flavobacteriaceae bacterium]|jgi:cation:H+ antiporter|nr:calcium/sodium antiporter [Flavobacteriaceae bacterium]MDA9879081.1 calcium/sodium antiporter [Flavobacteriaceae bacterium]
MDYIGIIVGLLLLIKGGDWLLDAAVGMSLKLDIPKIVIGMTVVSFATSAPELIVSIKSAIKGYPDLSLGNVVGSNIANLAFVLGIVLVISPIKVAKSFYKTDWPMMLLATVLLYFLLKNDGELNQFEGGVLLLLLILFLVYLLFFQEKAIIEDQIEQLENEMKLGKLVLLLISGGFCLWLGSEVLIKSAVSLAVAMGVSERIISITFVSIGTSIPELSASIIAIINKEKAISIGNLIGSNIFNILAVMGVTALISPIRIIDQALLNEDFIWMIGVTIIILPLVFFPNRMSLGRMEGVILLTLYSIFIAQMFL